MTTDVEDALGVSLSRGLPPLKERKNLLTDFDQMHGWYIQKSAYAALKLDGGEQSFDYQNKYLRINLRYRHDCGGNPSIAFDIVDASIRPVFSDMERRQRMRDAFEAERTRREADIARFKQTDRTFIGLLLILYQMEDLCCGRQLAFDNWQLHSTLLSGWHARHG
ncbi:hypothetical protein JAAARDRAFT_35563 [Jaapia argillacea MUCL 33604]|uniref:Uncharacterized protein n=1 Tax=Jaapia argillacea MUCL 33604 TaxID=933084 RepID=A0A067PT01_9AGAM|nr:hypothetical protein JAAARDRAFT_35563 [Jaapia argillacea MUCL 33604]